MQHQFSTPIPFSLWVIRVQRAVAQALCMAVLINEAREACLGCAALCEEKGSGPLVGATLEGNPRGKPFEGKTLRGLAA